MEKAKLDGRGETVKRTAGTRFLDQTTERSIVCAVGCARWLRNVKCTIAKLMKRTGTEDTPGIKRTLRGWRKAKSRWGSLR
jgi:hypothetical protein